MGIGNKKFSLITSFLFLANLIFAQDQDLLKNFLTVDDGLSHNEVTAIVQDHDGFIWIGTRGGLNRYDGYEFKIFNQVPGDTNSLVNPSIESLFVDKKGNIWIGTKSGGVSKFNPDTHQFTNIIYDYQHENSILPDSRVISFFEGEDEKIWMGTWGEGFIIYDEKSSEAEKFMPGVMVNAICRSTDNRYWIATSFNGLYEFIPETGELLHRTEDFRAQQIVEDRKRNVLWISGDKLIKYDLRNNKSVSYPKNSHSINLSSEGTIWLGTWGAGLYRFNPEEEEFQKFSIYPETFISKNKDYDAVLYIFEDRDKNTWLGTNGGGLCVLTPKLEFHSVGYHPDNDKGLINTRVMSVVDDSKGNLWIGTIGSGLIWSPDRKNFYQVPCKKNPRQDFFVIKYIFEDNSNRIWTGTNTGCYLVEFRNGKPELIKVQEIFKEFPDIGQGVSFLDFENQFWYGTLDDGLFVLDKKNNYRLSKRFSFDNTASGELKSDRISFQMKDSKNRIWLGTYNGLHIYNAKESTIHVAEHYFEISGNFTGNIITCMEEDQFGNIWIGTPNGLNKLIETGQNKFRVDYFTEKEGLASNFVKGISHDSDGNIWVSTSTSISMFNVKTSTFINFNERDGIKGKNFTEASVFRNKKGELFFGGDFGITYFRPENIKPLQKENIPIFTDFKIFNRHVDVGQKFGQRVILKKLISHVQEIYIPYNFNNFEIQFSALDFASMGGNSYKYMLENLDNEWQNLGKRRFVNFINLKPGEYILKVKSTNNHSIWSDESASIKIHILPPFWQTWYALLFYIIIVICIVSIIRWNAVKQVRLANSLEIEKLQHAQDQKMNELKLRFFTNISHEFRTPLTLILAPLKELTGKKDKYGISEEAEKKLAIVQNNSLRLMKLINQLLDFRKIETGNMKLSANLSNIEEFVSEVCMPFNELAEINGIGFRYKPALNTKQIWFDREKMEIILNNLISNSFKFIRENGKIEVALYEEEEEVLLCVSDNGPGIPSAEIQHIFDRFYQIAPAKGYGSSGIGLNLVKRFVEMHKATISVTSEPNVNTEFVVALKKGDQHLLPGEKQEIPNVDNLALKKESLVYGIFSGNKKQVAKSDESILIVEDSPEIKDYLLSLLAPMYATETASDGEEGFNKAIAKIPDLIISDVMMPGIDGLEFCKKIKNNKSTATVPFIFLTAKTDEQFRLLGTQMGADDYISKPFDPGLLLEKVKHILENRKKLKEQFSKSIRLEPSNIEITSAEEILIGKAISIIEQNLQNSNLSSDFLASELNMSNSSLYRKLKELTGFSIAEFIRSIRIKRAGQLLADRNKTITEIAYEVGFNDVKHFRAVFQKHFSCSPSEFREKL